MRSYLLPAFAPALIVAGCTSMGNPTAGDATHEDRAGYVSMAAASDLFEIQSSQLALARAQNQDVRQFAQMLITHHTQTTEALKAAAAASGVSAPGPILLPMQRQMLDELRGASAASFDQVYMRQQVPAHQMALTLHQNYAARGDAMPLRAAATAAVPVVRQHLIRAQQLD